MAKQDDKAGSPLSQTKITNTEQTTLIERFSRLEDRLHNLLACYQFYEITHTKKPVAINNGLNNLPETDYSLFDKFF